jgi:hypothetical protein
MTNPTFHDDWRELASRAGDGLEIALLWTRSTERVRLTVLDRRLGESFDVEVDGADALTAFRHPFAYMGRPGATPAPSTPRLASTSDEASHSSIAPCWRRSKKGLQ